jgi:hypothetical protein
MLLVSTKVAELELLEVELCDNFGLSNTKAKMGFQQQLPDVWILRGTVFLVPQHKLLETITKV